MHKELPPFQGVLGFCGFWPAAAARNDEVAPLVGNLDDLEIERLANVGFEFLDGCDFDLATYGERPHPNCGRSLDL